MANGRADRSTHPDSRRRSKFRPVPSGRSGLDPGDRPIDLQGFSPRAAFDYLVKLRPEFIWREIDDVAVFRPVEAWDAPTDSLSRPVTPFRTENAHPHYALHRCWRMLSR